MTASEQKPATPVRRFFWVTSAIEVGLLALLAVGSAGPMPIGGAVVLIMMFVGCGFIGYLGAIVACLERPRSAAAVTSVVLHSLLFALFFGFYAVEAVRKSEAMHALAAKWNTMLAERKAKEDAQQNAWARELGALVEAKNYAAARRFVREHGDLRVGAGKPVTQVLCPADGSGPDLPLLKLLIAKGAPSEGDLIVAASRCSVRSVESVLALGISLNALTHDGRTVLAKLTSPEMLEYMLTHGVGVNSRDASGATALMYHRSPEVTRLLLTYGADPKAVDNEGRSALHFGGPPEQLAAIYELILEAGADVNLKDAHDDSPLLAMVFHERRVWSESAAQVLVKHGARAQDQIKAVSFISDDVPIGPYLDWPGLDLAGKGGATLLVAAMARRKPDVVEQLLAAGANPIVEDEESHESALDYYRKNNLDYYFGERDRPVGEPAAIYRSLLDAAKRFQPAAPP